MDKKILQSFLQQGLIIMLTLLLFLITPFVLIVILCMFLVRLVVSKFAVSARPDLGNLLSPSSAAFATDLVYNKIPKTPLLVTVYLDGHLEIEEFRERVRKVIHETDPTTEKLLRPELQQFVTTWCGLLFWKWETSFHVSEHVRIWEEYAHVPELNEDDMLEIGNSLFHQSFSAGKSPWEFLVLHNTRAKEEISNDPRTTVLFRLHHGLADGYGLLKLVMADISSVPIRLAQPARRQRHAGHAWRTNFSFPFKCLHEIAKTIITCYDFNHWHIPESQMSHQLNGGVSNPISLKFVKSVKEKHSVSFAALLLAAFAGGIKKFMTEEGFKVPSQIHCFTLLPFTNHPLTLTNHLTGGFVMLPLDEESPLCRLKLIHKSLEVLKTSTIPLTLFYLIQLAGIQFGWISWKTFWNALPTGVMSNFPGPEDKCHCLGLPILDGGFAAGFGPGNSTVGLSALSYNGNLRIAVGVDQSILPKLIPWNGLVERVVEELSILDSLPADKLKIE